MKQIDWIRIGIIAGKAFGANLETDLELTPDPLPHRIRRDINGFAIEHAVLLLKWRGPGDFVAWLGYSEKLNVLVVYLPSDQ